MFLTSYCETAFRSGVVRNWGKINLRLFLAISTKHTNTLTPTLHPFKLSHWVHRDMLWKVTICLSCPQLLPRGRPPCSPALSAYKYAWTHRLGHEAQLARVAYGTPSPYHGSVAWGTESSSSRDVGARDFDASLDPLSEIKRELEQSKTSPPGGKSELPYFTIYNSLSAPLCTPRPSYVGYSPLSDLNISLACVIKQSKPVTP